MDREDNEKCNESDNVGKQVSAAGGGKWLHREQGGGCDSRLQGGIARVVLRDGERVRSDPFGLAQGGKGTAGLLHRA